MNKMVRIFLYLVFFVLCQSSLSAQHDKFVFQKLEGRAVVSRTGGSTWLAVQSAQPVEVRPGDLINVEGDGRGEIFYPDGSIIRIKKNAMITVMRSGIQLRLGNAWLKVRRQSDIFKVFTPVGSCAVLGTSFDVDVDRYGRSEVRVFSGIVAVRAAEDTKNRQLVLQTGMKTTLNKKDGVADVPEKFQPSIIETSLVSEWENRKLLSVPASVAKQKEIQQLPPIRKEIEDALPVLPPIGSIVDSAKPLKEEKTIIIARQRSAFLENLRKQQLEKDSVIGGNYLDEDQARRDGHNRELGQHKNSENIIRNRADVDREYFNTQNRILRVQSKIRQIELEASSLIGLVSPTLTQQKTIAGLQSQQVSLRDEHRALVQKLRDLQNLKR